MDFLLTGIHVWVCVISANTSWFFFSLFFSLFFLFFFSLFSLFFLSLLPVGVGSYFFSSSQIVCTLMLLTHKITNFKGVDNFVLDHSFLCSGILYFCLLCKMRCGKADPTQREHFSKNTSAWSLLFQPVCMSAGLGSMQPITYELGYRWLPL